MSWRLEPPKKKNSIDAFNGSNTENGNSNNNYAKTRFYSRGLGRFFSNGTTTTATTMTLLLFRPYSGKTHQLRVAAKSVGLPLLGDPIYSDGSAAAAVATAVESGSRSRTYLHATALHIVLPSDGDNEPTQNITVFSPPPFEQLLCGGDDCSDDDDERSERRSAFRNLVIELFEKHCGDCDPILDLIRASNYTNTATAAS